MKDLGEMSFVERELAFNWTRRQRWKDLAAVAARAEGAGQQSTESIPMESDNICRRSLCHFTAAIVNGRWRFDGAVPTA